MKEHDRKQLEELWLEGCGYSNISKALNLNVNTVKSYCRRHGYIGDRGKAVAAQANGKKEESRCKYCGSFIIQNSESKKKIFCSDRCRMNWWNSHQELVRRKAEYEFVCENCGRNFKAYGNAKRKYCCHRCYIEHRYHKEHQEQSKDT